jgi:hypothetical protein
MYNKANILNEKSDFLCSKMFKLLNQIKGNSINKCDFFKFIIHLGGVAILIPQPGCQKS